MQIVYPHCRYNGCHAIGYPGGAHGINSSSGDTIRSRRTLIDSVYEHVLAWYEALEQVGIALSVWRIHRRIGMSGGLLINALLREAGAEITADLVEELQRRHANAYARRSAQVRPLPGTEELLNYLTDSKVLWAVATSGRMAGAGPALR